MTQQATTPQPIEADQLAAVLELYKADNEIKKALEVVFLQGKSLQEAGTLCGKTKQGMAYHVTRVRKLHASLLASLQHLKGTK